MIPAIEESQGGPSIENGLWRVLPDERMEAGRVVPSWVAYSAAALGTVQSTGLIPPRVALS